jgi:type 1 glutamine amidotransferase/sugar phosphate isomerase/epimerase
MSRLRHSSLFTCFAPCLLAGLWGGLLSRPLPAAEPSKPGAAPARTVMVVAPEERQKIEAAIPTQAPAVPAARRKLLIFSLNVGYPGHRSIAHAKLAMELMGRKTGAFEVVASDDPAVFQPESLRRFDAVFFNNTVGNPFTDPALRQSLADFVYGGGGLLGVHGTTVGFTRWPGAVEDWPEFGRMIGGRGARHRENTEPVFVKVEDPAHPLTAMFNPQGFEYRDEFFRVGPPYSRDRLRVLLSIDTQKTDLERGKYAGHPERKDKDYALAWCHEYGRGRVFYSTIAHSPKVFWDPAMLRFYLAAAQFALGDLPAPTLPSAKLTPAVRAQEKLGWRLAITAYSFHKYTLFETIDKTAALGLPYLEGLSFQKVSPQIPRNFDLQLSDAELNQIREKLDTSGVRLLTYYYHRIPGDEAGCRKVFEFGRKIGIETFLSEPDPAALDMIERMANEYRINVALHNHDQKGSPNYWCPAKILEQCRGRGPRIGACVDMGYWMRSGIDPVEGARLLKGRLMTVQMHDLNERTATGTDVPWGTGTGQTRQFMEEVRKLGLRPTAFGVEYSRNWLTSTPEVQACIGFFNETCVQLAR